MKEVSRPTAHNTAAALTTPGLAGTLLPKVLGMTEVANSKKNYGLTEKVGTAYTPQSNGIIEQVHQMIADALCTLEHHA
jgi:hypothetical protein